MFKFVFAAALVTLAALPAVAAPCEHPFANDAATLKAMVKSHPGEPAIVASTKAPTTVAAMTDTIVKALGPPTKFKIEDVGQLMWLITPAASFMLFYDRDACRITSIKIDLAIILKGIKATPDLPALLPDGLPQEEVNRWGRGSYLRTI